MALQSAGHRLIQPGLREGCCVRVLRTRSSSRRRPQLTCASARNLPVRSDASGAGVYALMLVNAALFVGQTLHLPFMPALALHHSHPQWWQWISHMFMHANWAHISNNLFFLLTFGRLVEETEGAGGVVAVYILCGLGAALASFLLSPANTVSVGASGAIFGLFAVSVLTRLASFSLRRLLESVVLGQFVVRQLLDELKAQAGGGLMLGGLQVSHIAHLAGAMAGVMLVLLLTRLPTGDKEPE